MRREIVLLIALLLVLGGLLYFFKGFKQAANEDARKFFSEDLAEKYPGADVREILNVTQIGEGPDAYLKLKARVVKGGATPCPELIHVYYYYPPQNFIAEKPEEITKGCVVCAETATCVVAWPEEAIIASHTYAGGEQARDYIKQYPDAHPQVSLLGEYLGQQKVWEVSWDSPSADYRLNAHISEYGNKIIDVQAQPKG